MTFPAGLDTIELGRLCDGELPSGLQALIFGSDFDQPLELLPLPKCLRSLTTGFAFNHKLTNESLPSGLVTLTLGHCFDQSLTTVASWF